MQVKRGDVFTAELKQGFGAEQGGLRPVLVVQNDAGNKHSPTTIVVPVTTSKTKKPLPTHITISKEHAGLTHDSVALCEQVRCIDKERLKTRCGFLCASQMVKVDKALAVAVGLKHG